jgi:hypothetical protein
LARLKIDADSLTIARAQINFSMLCLVSTRYREVKELLDSSYDLVRSGPTEAVETELANSAWMLLIGVPWSLFSLGEFSVAFAKMDSSIAAFETGGDFGAANFIQVFRGALHFHAMDYEGTLRDCGTVATSRPSEYHAIDVDVAPTMPLKRRIALIYYGLAEAGLGNIAVAHEYFLVAEEEMRRQPVHLDWYWRLALEWGIVNILIAQSDYAAAVARAVRLCELAMKTDERTWQALAWEALARAVLSNGDATEAVSHVVKALATCEGVQIPLAEWRVHATATITYKATSDAHRAREHARLGAATTKHLAESLPEGDPVRLQFERRSAAFFHA